VSRILFDAAARGFSTGEVLSLDTR
jgi:hypothetical protein